MLHALLIGVTAVALVQHDELSVVDHHDPASEAIYLVERLRRLHAEGARWDEMALLVRTRRQLIPLVDGLERGGIPIDEYRPVPGGEEPASDWDLEE